MMKKGGWQSILGTLVCLIGIISIMSGAIAANYPIRPVRLIVGFAPGGGGDALARLIGARLSAKWGQPVVVDNIEGADGTIAIDVVAHAAPDGYTIGIVSPSFAITPSLNKLNYDPIRSLAPVTLLEEEPYILVVNPSSVPAQTLGELVALAKSKPGVLNVGSGGLGTSPFVAMQILMQRADIKMTNVTYKGGSPALVALLGGEVQAMMGAFTTGVAQAKTGKLRALAVTTAVRAPASPDIPTVAEAANLPDYDEPGWDGILAPAQTPKEIVNQLSRDMAAVMKEPGVAQTMFKQGMIVVGSSPEEFGEKIKKDIVRYEPILRALKAK